MRLKHTRESSPKRREDKGHIVERDDQRKRTYSTIEEDDESSDGWDYEKSNYRSETPYFEEEEEEEYSNEYYSRNPKSKSGKGSRETETITEKRPRRIYRSTGRQPSNPAESRRPARRTASRSRRRPSSKKSTSPNSRSAKSHKAARGFAAMPTSEVRRIAAMGGHASHGGKGASKGRSRSSK